MAKAQYLAMTASEIAATTPLPENLGWMACHFSPYSTGLSNLPDALPEGSLLILDDSMPMQGHDPTLVTAQLEARMDALHAKALLLDFQRPFSQDAAHLVKLLFEAFDNRLVVPAVYAGDFTCPVFLPPLPLSASFSEALAPWAGRDIWLEMGLDGEEITLTKNGAQILPLPHYDHPDTGHWDEGLHCHYQIYMAEDIAKFTLWRTRADWLTLLEKAEAFGVTAGVGLWQEFSNVGRGYDPAEQATTIVEANSEAQS